MISPYLVHFPDAEPRIIMHASGAPPKPGELLITGWVVDRQIPATETTEYDVEVWVKPLAA
jgi:hypothetical protein